VTLSAVVFDVNGTLSDLSPLASRLAEVGAPAHLLTAWFAGVLRDGIGLTLAGGFADFRTVALGVLEPMLARVDGVERTAKATAGHVLDGVTDLPVHPDVSDGLRQLRTAGLRVVTLTNGSVAITDALLRRAELLDLVDARREVDASSGWKPARAAYERGLAAIGVPPGEAAMVAAHPWDVDGAMRTGMTGAWLNRDDLPYPPALLAPDVSAADLPTLAGQLLERVAG
jgi:2-haloacid dehalogenase